MVLQQSDSSATPGMIGCAVCLSNNGGRRMLLLPEDAYIASQDTGSNNEQVLVAGL